MAAKPKKKAPSKKKTARKKAKRECNAQETVFVLDYVIHKNAYKAAVTAKYADSTARVKAHKWVSKSKSARTKPWVYDAIQFEMAKVVKRARKTKDDIVRELELLGFSNMMDFVKIEKDGTSKIDLKELTRDQAAALSQMVIDGSKTTIKLVDKKASLELLGKEHGMFKTEHEHAGSGGGPIQYQDMTGDAALAAIKALAGKTGATSE